MIDFDLRFRYHAFFKIIDNLCLNYKISEDGFEVDKIILPDNNISHLDGGKIFDMHYCDKCGELFIGGNKYLTGEDDDGEIVASYPKIDQLPEKQPEADFSLKSNYEYGLFWPVNSYNEINYEGRWKQRKQRQIVVKQRTKAHLDIKTGKIDTNPQYSGEDEPNENQMRVFMYEVFDSDKNRCPISTSMSTL